MTSCGCRCIVCKSQRLKSHSFVAPDSHHDAHHTCESCGAHFNHLDGETYAKCVVCRYP